MVSAMPCDNLLSLTKILRMTHSFENTPYPSRVYRRRTLSNMSQYFLRSRNTRKKGYYSMLSRYLDILIFMMAAPVPLWA